MRWCTKAPSWGNATWVALAVLKAQSVTAARGPQREIRLYQIGNFIVVESGSAEPGGQCCRSDGCLALSAIAL
jgi:hypothetical protein